MTGFQKNNEQVVEKTPTNKESEIKSVIYPQLEPLSFSDFLRKIGMGLLLSFLPAFVYSLVSGSKLPAAWAISLLIVAGIYFLIGGCSDLTQTSAKKSLNQYLATVDRTGKRDEKFKYNVGFFQFGKNYEYIAAAICLFAISFLISSMSG
ncbi:MAG: hypothetical protein JSU57_05480 [Candidatus Heimdallarchaeota archaeon]|nr:MAG: hypothetical protein JSU57_05480 [Candidatus Heimdallarchaeota archaeon]